MSNFVPRTLDELAQEWPSDLDHISATSVKMAARCPEQWRQRYVLGRKIPPVAVLMQGRSDHAAIERSMRQKITSGTDLPVGEVQDFFVSHFENQIEESGGINEVEIRGGGDKTKAIDEIKRHGQRNVASYHTRVSPTLQPTAVEQQFSLQVRDLPVRVDGYIDLLASYTTRSLLDEGDQHQEVIVDRKGSGRAKTKPDPEWVIQAEVYQLAYPRPHEWHITKTDKGTLALPQAFPDLKLPVVPRARAERTLQQIVAEIGHYMRTYGPDGEWPVRGKLHPWACSYCGYRQDCWGWQ